MSDDLERRVARYASRYFLANGMTEWPTVRRVARALRVRQTEIEEICSGYGICSLSFWFAENQELGDGFVEADTPQVEAAWLSYLGHYSHA